MDLKLYYQKVREEQARITDPFPIIVSLDTADGGKAGCLSEVPKALAAKMTMDGTARLATSEESDAYRAGQAQLRQSAAEAAAAQKLELKVVSAADYNLLAQLKQQEKE